MSEIFHEYMHGESIPSSILPKVEGGLELYGEIIHGEWRLDKATSQPDFFGEVWLTKSNPIDTTTHIQDHLQRPPDTREGRRQLENGLSKSTIRISRPVL